MALQLYLNQTSIKAEIKVRQFNNDKLFMDGIISRRQIYDPYFLSMIEIERKCEGHLKAECISRVILKSVLEHGLGSTPPLISRVQQ